jgi:two-component SAPR family response regulator
MPSNQRQENGESKSKSEIRRFQVTVYIDPILALLEFKPHFYDLLLIDIDMPSVGGFDLGEKILKLDPNIKICFMSTGEVHYGAIREYLYASEGIDCFIKKRIPCADSVNRVLQELQ